MPSGVPEMRIVGAGPTGLMLAGRLTRCVVRMRIIENKAGPPQENCATAVPARTWSAATSWA